MERPPALPPAPRAAGAVPATAPVPLAAPAPVAPTLVVAAGPGGAPEKRLKFRNRVGEQGSVATPLHGEVERPIKLGQLLPPEPPSLSLPKPHSRDPFPVQHLVVEGHRVAADVKGGREGLEPLAGGRIHPGGGIEGHRRSEKALPAIHLLQLGPHDS